jgi:hypothetical protein
MHQPFKFDLVPAEFCLIEAVDFMFPSWIGSDDLTDKLVGAQSIALRESLRFPAEQCSALRLPASFAEVSNYACQKRTL